MVRPSKLQPLGAPGSFFSSGIELSEQFCQRTAVCVKSEVRSSEALVPKEAWQPCSPAGTHDCDEGHLAGAEVRLEAVRRHVVPDDHLVQPLPVAGDLQS